jgi:hypothetical protein
MITPNTKLKNLIEEALLNNNLIANLQSDNKEVHSRMDLVAEALLKVSSAPTAHLRNLKSESGGNITLLFEPTYVKLARISDGGEITAKPKGKIYLGATSLSGQYAYSKDPISNIELDDFIGKSEQDLARMVAKHAPELQHIADGRRVNTIGLETIGFMISRDNDLLQDNRQYVSPTMPDTARYPPHHLNDHLSGGQSAPYVLAETGTKHWVQNREFHVGRLNEYGFYSQLGLGKFFTEHEDRFNHALKSQCEVGRDAFKTAVEGIAERKMALAGIALPELKSSREQFYPSYIISFITEVDDPKVVRYRKEFIDQTYSMMFGGLTAEDWVPNDLTEAVNRTAAKVILGLMENGNCILDFSLRDIDSGGLILDSGAYPYEHIAKKMGIPNASKSEIRYGFELIGLKIKSQQDTGRSSSPMMYQLPSIGKPETLQGYFKLAKIPKEWLKNDVHGGNAMTVGVDDNHPHMYGRMSLYSNLNSSLMSAGAKFDTFKGSRDTASVKQLSAKWRWLSKNQGSFVEKLDMFDEKYKVTATMKDYALMLDGLVDTVLKRTAMTHGQLSDTNKCFEFHEDEKKIHLKLEEVGSQYMQSLDDEHEQMGMSVDEETGEEYHDEYPSVDMPKMEEPGHSEIFRAASKNAGALSTLASKNEQLHKIYNKFVQAGNKNSKFNIEWTPLFDEPLKLDDNIELVPIANRLDLLEEGSKMNHCVFSYMNKCMSGESIILSARYIDTGEPLATIELLPEDLDGFVDLQMEQCYGVGNSNNRESKLVEGLVYAWLERYENGEIEVPNALKIIENGHDAPDAYENIYDDPVNEGSIAERVPYNGDGAYLSYFLFDEMTPDGMSMASLFESNETLLSFYYSSEFRQEIEQICALSKKLEVSPLALVHYKIEWDIPAFKGVEAFKVEHDSLKTLISQVLSNYGKTCTSEQIFKLCDDALFQETGMKLGNKTALVATIESASYKVDDILKHARQLEPPQATPNVGSDIASPTFARAM